MKVLQFDENGYLKSEMDTIIEVDIPILQQYFSSSNTRKWLFDNYLNYIESFQRLVFPYFEQWIDGSFISQTQNPRDIDIVTFLDYRVFNQKINQLDNFLSFSRESEGLDTYIVKHFPENHSKFTDYMEIRELWKARFAFDREERPKSFVKINFEKAL